MTRKTREAAIHRTLGALTPSIDTHNPDDPLSCTPTCLTCGDDIYPPQRSLLGYTTCLHCGEEKAREVKHTIGFIPKSNYVYISPRSLGLLKATNPKRQQEE